MRPFKEQQSDIRTPKHWPFPRQQQQHQPTHLKQLDIRVEQITLRHMDALVTQLMHQAQDPCCDSRLPACRRAGKLALAAGVFQHDPIQLWHVHLVGLGAGGDIEGEAVALEDAVGYLVHRCFYFV